MSRRIFLLLTFAIAAAAQRKALVGGTLIDGFGGPPVRHSVVLIDGEKIQAVGQVGSLPVPPDAQVISTEGMSVLPGLWICMCTRCSAGIPTTRIGIKHIRRSLNR